MLFYQMIKKEKYTISTVWTESMLLNRMAATCLREVVTSMDQEHILEEWGVVIMGA